jgi:hypothetical protein
MPLSNQELEQMKQDAMEVYPMTTTPIFGIPPEQINRLQKERRTAFITGVTLATLKEREAAKPLVEALEMAKLHIASETICEDIDEALTNYNQKVL